MAARRPRSDRERLRFVSYQALTKRLRGKVWADNESERQQRHRAEWPELWQAIDEIIALVDEDYPPLGQPDTGPRL
jgi:hypothetical protein